MVTTLKENVKEKEREAAQFETKHKKESDKASDQSKEQIRTLTNKLAAMEQELQKSQTARTQAQKEAAEAREAAERAAAQRKQLEQDLARARAEAREGDKTRVVSLEKALGDAQKEHAALAQSYREEQALRKKYWNLMEDMKGKIRVYCRTRPALKGDGTSVVDAPDPYSCLLRHPKSGQHSFLFDCVYGPEATQETVFDDVKNMVQSAIDGYNVCIFAYGQTGSGKTHTMVGDGTHHAGIVPRALRHLFELLAKSHKSTPGFTSAVNCYMLELYNEQLIDMLADEKERGEVKIKKDANGVVYAHNAQTVKLHDSKEAETILQRGFSSRRTESTNMNERSSRSHLIITLTVQSKDPGTGATTHGKISFIDLAGSERVAKSGVSNDRLREAQAINLSLSALGDVISALSKGESFVPYRNHKLTLLMSDSLGGNAKTLMIVCVSPSASNVEESFSSLQFATRAKTITNNPVKSVESQEVTRLKKIIADMKRGEKGPMPEELSVLSPSDDSRDKDAEIARLNKVVEDLQHALRAAQASPRVSSTTPRASQPAQASTTPREAAQPAQPTPAPAAAQPAQVVAQAPTQKAPAQPTPVPAQSAQTPAQPAHTPAPAPAQTPAKATTPRDKLASPRGAQPNGVAHHPSPSAPAPIVVPTPAPMSIPSPTRIPNTPTVLSIQVPTTPNAGVVSPSPPSAPAFSPPAQPSAPAPAPSLTVPSSAPARPTSPLPLQLPYSVVDAASSPTTSPQFPSRPPPQPPTGGGLQRPAPIRPPLSPKGPPPPTPPHGKSSTNLLIPKPPSPTHPSPPASPTPSPPATPSPPPSAPRPGAPKVPALSLPTSAPARSTPAPSLAPTPAPAPSKETASALLSPTRAQTAQAKSTTPSPTQPSPAAVPGKETTAPGKENAVPAKENAVPAKENGVPPGKEPTPRKEAPTPGRETTTPRKSPRDLKSPREKKSPKTEEDHKTKKTPREAKSPRDAVPESPTHKAVPESPHAKVPESPHKPVLESPHSAKGSKPPNNLASVAAAAAAAASKRHGTTSPSPRIADSTSVQGKQELGVVLPSKPGDKLVHPKRPSMTGRKKPTKNAIQNKKEMELRSQEAKASAGTSSASGSSSSAPKPRAVSQSIGGFSLLANLVVNKPLAAVNGSSPRPGTPTNDLNSSTDSLGSTGGGSVEFKQLLDSGGPKLMQIKGRRRVKVRLMELSYQSLNQGDVFILDVGSKLFLWNGSRANRMEKAKGLDVCTRIKDKDRNTRATIITLDENDNNPEFWDPLGGRGPIAEESEGGDDAMTDATEEDVLYKVEEQNGQHVPVVIESRRPAKEMLESSHCYVLDGFSEMYIWIGRGCTTGSKNAISHIAKDLFLAKPDRPSWARISRLTEGTETVLFKEKFSNWPDKLPIATQAAVIKGRVANISKDDKVDIQKMYNYNPPAPRVVEGTDGKLQIWVISDFEKKEIPQEQYGHFYSAESYIILYTYMVKWKECYMIFFWQGRDSSINEKGTSAVLTVDLDEQCGGAAEQIRVVQNQEPMHFLKLFEGKMIVHKGRMNGAQLPTTLYHVRETHAVQVVARTSSLNSNDAFILRTPTHLYVWNGTGATPASRKAAQQISQTPFMRAGGASAPRKPVEVGENSEPGGFWTAFPEGDPTQYVKHVWEKPPRLFHCTNSSGRFAPREVFRATQDDLVQDDVMILDLYRCAYVWEGRGANEEEKRLGMELAVEYVRNAPDKRPADAPIYHVKNGREPRLFISAFHGWDSTSTILDLNESTHIPLVEDMLRQYSRAYTLEELLTKPKELDQTTLEFYLSDSDFFRHFSMSKEEYRAMPIWKRDIQKKKVGLY